MALRSLLGEGNSPEIALSMSTGQSVNDNTLTVLSWDTLDKSLWWESTGVPTATFTLPETGWLSVSVFDLDWGSPNNTSGYRSVGVSINGGTAFRFDSGRSSPSSAANSGNTAHGGSHTFQVNAGDTLSIKVRQDSGSALTPAAKQLRMRYERRGNA